MTGWYIDSKPHFVLGRITDGKRHLQWKEEDADVEKPNANGSLGPTCINCKVWGFLELLGKPKADDIAARCNPEESKYSVGANAKKVISRLEFSLTGDTGDPDEMRKLDFGHYGRTTSVKVGRGPVGEVGIEAIPS